MTTSRLPSASPDHDPTAPETVAGASKVVGWGLALWGGVQIAGAVLERKPLASAIVQAAAAEWGAGRIGIAWSDPLAPMPGWAAIGRRVGRGAALGAAAAGLVIATSLAMRSATAAWIGPSGGLLVLGLFASILAAVRDELLLRGIVLRATRGLLPTWVSLLVCGAAAAAARFGIDGQPATSLAAEALRGIALATLWTRDRGAWMAFAANTSWMWILGAVVHGGFIDARFVTEPDGGAATVAVLAAVAVAAWASIRRRHS